LKEKGKTPGLEIASLVLDKSHFALAQNDNKKRRVARTTPVLQNSG
jgi:hypothetical protein